MTTLRPVACENRLCEYYAGAIGPDDDPVYFCRAYPVGIPLEILDGVDPHEALRGDEVADFYYSGPYEVTEKHLHGQHPQKRHGWRYGGAAEARSSEG